MLSDVHVYKQLHGYHRKILWCSGIFRENVVIFRVIPPYSVIFRNIPWYSAIFRDIPPYSVIFRHIPWYSGIPGFHNAQPVFHFNRNVAYFLTLFLIKSLSIHIRLLFCTYRIFSTIIIFSKSKMSTWLLTY
jgi:hypothetical protein